MLVAAPERWDEACFAVPALRAMVAAGLETGILCPASQCDLWQTVSGVRVVDYPAKVKSKQMAWEISGNWQASLAWETGFAADVFKIAAIPRRLGPSERKLNKLLTHPLEFTVGPLEHRVRHYLAAVESLGIPTGQPEFFASAALGIDPVPDAVLLSPSSDFGPSHEWPFERWLEIGKSLMSSGWSITVASIEGDRGLGKTLADALGVHAEWFAFGVLLPLAGYRLVIAADGSLPHFASHAGATCVVLFGPNDPAWKRPLGRRHTVIRRHVECAPCLLSKCPLDLRCQGELTTERVWQAVAEKLAISLDCVQPAAALLP
jgi:ADP-heptose:LPS heptosyltransferase